MSKRQSKSVIIDLPVRLTDMQKLDLAEQLNEKLEELRNLEDSKKSYVEAKNSEIKEVKEQVDTLHDDWVKGVIHEPVDCYFEYHSPTVGEKTLIRTDTNIPVKVYPMSEYDLENVDQSELFIEYANNPEIPEELKLSNNDSDEDDS